MALPGGDGNGDIDRMRPGMPDVMDAPMNGVSPIDHGRAKTDVDGRDCAWYTGRRRRQEWTTSQGKPRHPP